MALPSLLPVTKARSNAREAGRSLAFKQQDGGCVLPSFVQVVHFLSFSFVDIQNTYSCKSDLVANFSAVYIFPCTLNGDIP